MLGATKNKLPFLKHTLVAILSNKQPDEEIIVINGNSKDGSKEYLSELANDRMIDSSPRKTSGNLDAELRELLACRINVNFPLFPGIVLQLSGVVVPVL